MTDPTPLTAEENERRNRAIVAVAAILRDWTPDLGSTDRASLAPLLVDTVFDAERDRYRRLEGTARTALELCECPPDWLMQDGSHDRSCIQSEPTMLALRAALSPEEEAT